MKANHFTLSSTAGLLAGALLVLINVHAADSDAFPIFDNNYIKVSATGASINGSKAAYQARTTNAKSGAAGIEDLSYGFDLSKDTNLQIDGKALPGAENYLLQFKLAKNEVGTFEAGYKRFRTFYDDIGGFFPLNNAWLPIYRRELYVDRGKFFVNASLTLPNVPVFTFKYANETRSGRKDSTIWGDSDLTGIPIWSQSALNPVSANRKILPAYIQLGERLETWEATMRHTVGNTTFVVSWGGDRINNLDSRSVDRYVGELKPYPAIPSNPLSLVPNNFGNNPNRGMDTQGVRENGQTFGGRLETVVNDKLTVFAGVSYHHATLDISALRLITATFNTGGGVREAVGAFNTPGGRPPYSYNSSGSIKQDVLTANVGVQMKPTPTLNVELALRGEKYEDSGNNTANYVNNAVVLSTGAVTAMPVNAPSSFNNEEKPWTPAIDVRYTGIRNLALYGSWEYRSSKQDERGSYGALSVNTTAGTVSGSISPFNDNIKEKHSNIKVGANWTPTGLLSARAELFSKDHENRFEGYGTSLGGYYILNYDIYGAKLTGILKPLPVLSLTTRYIVQRGKASVAEDGFAKGDSNDARRHQISETIDWNPNKSVYVQANANRVYDSIVTAYPRVTGTAQNVLRNSNNNYWNGDVIVGFVIDANTDAQLQGTVYRADNYEPAQAVATVPYGAGVREYSLNLGLKYKISSKTVVSGKVGYFESKNDTTGGFTNFRGPLAYIAVEHAF